MTFCQHYGRESFISGFVISPNCVNYVCFLCGHVSQANMNHIQQWNNNLSSMLWKVWWKTNNVRESGPR